ncbi:RPAP1-like protein [Kockiozyma suomiensis]|uniref:RPAP1-like protein n=1 Tax=Kockiozyma suomiensis TaxID=1337062 RepID=UPI003343EFB3
MNLVRDIVERPSAPPVAPNIVPPRTSPPVRKSLWRSRRTPQTAIATSPPLKPASEAERISAENDARLAAMSPNEIEREKAELEAMLPPGLLKRIMTRDPTAADAILMSNSDDGDIFGESSAKEKESKLDNEASQSKQPTLEDVEDAEEEPSDFSTTAKDANAKKVRFQDDSKVQESDKAVQEAQPAAEQSQSIHFPQPTSTTLDPNSPDFQQQLHDKYFPDLPKDAAALAWMQPVSAEEDASSPYFHEQESVSPADIRFDFRGDIVPPSRSTSLPTTLGLHHHSDSPGYAGYTIPELAHLCRSSVSAQRAIAVQVMGRILYKLGVNAYGEYVGDALWDIVQHTKVIESIVEAADENKTRHLGLRSVSVEALWLWKKGGGRRRKTD